VGTTASGTASGHRHQGFRTTCGREVRAGWLTLGDVQRPARRVSLDIGQAPGGRDGTWAALTVAEARRLAAVLLEQAAAAERGDGRAGRGDGRAERDGAAERGDRVAAAKPAAAGQITVTHASGDAYAVTTRGHTVVTDQPVDAGGTDEGATPTELLVAALASCVAYFVGRYLVRHGLPREGLAVTAEFRMAAGRPARVGDIQLRIEVPGGVPAERRAALLAVAAHCTVHNTLRQEPDVAIALA
jgi:putative redox protein